MGSGGRLFRCRLGKGGLGSLSFVTTRFAAARTAWARAGRAAATLLRSIPILGLQDFFGNDLGRDAFDLRLRAGAVCHRRGLGSRSRLALGAILTALATLITITAVFPRLLILVVLFATLLHLRLRILDDRLRTETQIVAIGAVHVVLIQARTVAILEITAILMLEAILHLGLGCGDDPVVMLCVLQIILGHDAVAGALSVTGKCGILFGDMLGCTPDLQIRTGAVVGPAERISALAIEVVIAAAVIVVTTPSTALVLLLRGHAACRQCPDQDFACRAQVDQGACRFQSQFT